VKRWLVLLLIVAAVPAGAKPTEIDRLRAELVRARAEIAAQDGRLRALEARLPAIEARAQPVGPPAAVIAARPPVTATADSTPVERVGEAPATADRAPEVAVLGDQGSIVTRRGQLTAEFQSDYTRVDRNRALFRGVSAAEVLLIGVFDINQTREDLLTASAALRYGLTSRLEIGGRLPYVHRTDSEVLAPVQQGTANANGSSIDNASKGDNIGDVELSARYQLRAAHGGWPFLIANVQGLVPTGSDPFKVPRNAVGAQLVSATGAGFWSLAPSLTAILPSDPAVLFGSVGYAKNFGRNVDTQIGDVRITRVDPGDGLNFSAGIGIALNQRTTLDLGYAHTWLFSTFTRQQSPGQTPGTLVEQAAHTRDLQLGRLLFGVSYRATDRSTINWSVELGATRDANDLRTVLRIPVTLLGGSR